MLKSFSPPKTYKEIKFPIKIRKNKGLVHIYDAEKNPVLICSESMYNNIKSAQIPLQATK